MKRKHSLVVVAVLGATLLASGMAQARDADVRWSVTIGSPGGVPVAVSPPRWVVQPVPVPVAVRGAYRAPTRWDDDGDGIPNHRDRLYNPRWDIDGDGIPNRHDRAYNAPYGHGVNGNPYRHDRYAGDLGQPRRDGERWERWDRDGDGIPNRHDRQPDGPWRAPGYGR